MDTSLSAILKNGSFSMWVIVACSVIAVAVAIGMYLLRAFGGGLYLAGAAIMTANVWLTIAGRLRDERPMHIAAFDPSRDRPLTGGNARGLPSGAAPAPLPATPRPGSDLVPAE